MDWKRFSFIGLIIVVLFGMVVMVGQVKQPPLLIITSMLATTIAVATPLDPGRTFRCILRTCRRGQHRYRRHDAHSRILRLAERYLHV